MNSHDLEHAVGWVLTGAGVAIALVLAVLVIAWRCRGEEL